MIYTLIMIIVTFNFLESPHKLGILILTFFFSEEETKA